MEPVANSLTADLRGVKTHRLMVRATHWINTIAFIGLVISGVAILLAHPRLYWGEVGAFGSPALIELPLPLNVEQSGWGRSLHFLSAWVSVANGLLYVVSGLLSSHFSKQMRTYDSAQRVAYLGVVFVLFPLMLATGLAMSPAIAAVIPIIVLSFGGHQSARTIHFVVTNVLVLFLILHIVMVWRTGFTKRVRGMIVGRRDEQEQP